MPLSLRFDHSEEYYTKLHQGVIQGKVTGRGDEPLDSQELSVLGYILNQSNGYDLSPIQIAKRFEFGRRTAYRIIDRLSKKGFLYQDRRGRADNESARYVAAEHPRLLEEWLRKEGLNYNFDPPEADNQPSTTESSTTEPPTTEKSSAPEPESKSTDTDREKQPDRAPSEPAEADRTIPLPLTERLGTIFYVEPDFTPSPPGPITDGFPLFTDPPYLSDRHPIRYSLPYDFAGSVDRQASLDLMRRHEEVFRSWIGELAETGEGGVSHVSQGGFYLLNRGGGCDTHDTGVCHTCQGGCDTHDTLNKRIRLQHIGQSIIPLLHSQRYSKVSKQRAGAGASLSPGNTASKNRKPADLKRSRNRWVWVFGGRDTWFYRDVEANDWGKEEETQRQTADRKSQHRPDDKSQLQPKVAGENLKNGDPVKRAYRAIWVEPFQEKAKRPTEPTGQDRRRGKEFGLDPRRVMLLRQVAELVISPHVFDGENTYDSPGRDPWAIRMYCDLAFPNTDLNASQKHFLDVKVGQALPSSPAEWAKVLLHGLEREWSPRYPENFAKAYRHRMDIERDPNRAPMPGGRRMSRTNFIYGKGIDLTEDDLSRLAPPKMNDDGTHPGREMSPVHGPDFDARELSERVEVRGSPFDEDGTLARNPSPTPETDEDKDEQSPSE